MKNSLILFLLMLLIGGCAPKMGRDIVIEPVGNLRLANSESEVMLGVLAILGVPVENGTIRIGTDVRVNNKWHSDITIVSLDYTLNDGKEIIAIGEVKKDDVKPLIVSSGVQKNIPLEFRIDTNRLNTNRVLGIIQSKRKLLVKGKALIKVWGIEKEYPFEKEVTKLVQKALKDAL
jgi:hypothetical protein